MERKPRAGTGCTAAPESDESGLPSGPVHSGLNGPPRRCHSHLVETSASDAGSLQSFLDFCIDDAGDVVAPKPEHTLVDDLRLVDPQPDNGAVLTGPLRVQLLVGSEELNFSACSIVDATNFTRNV